ncbi:MAG: transcriptional regulator, partial [Acidimicrobiales bacterium]
PGRGRGEVAAAAFERGRRLAEASRVPGRRGGGSQRTLAAAVELLAELGFEPRRTGADEVVAANCPFRPLADTAPETVCQAAEAFAGGVLTGLGGRGVEACLDRASDRCCVVLRATSNLNQ